MRDVVLFVEDTAHREIVGRIVRRLARQHDVVVELDWRTAAATRNC